MTTGDLRGRRALVIGGSRGIGAAIVRRLASDGASVVFTCASSTGSRQGAGEAGRGERWPGERTATREGVARLDGLDILVNNAGVLLHDGVDAVSRDDSGHLFAGSVRAIFFGLQAASAHPGERRPQRHARPRA